MARTNEVVFPNLMAELGRTGETQSDLAELLGISKPTVSRKVSGQIDWTQSEIDKLCEHFNKDYYHLFIKRR